MVLTDGAWYGKIDSFLRDQRFTVVHLITIFTTLRMGTELSFWFYMLMISCSPGMIMRSCTTS